MMKPEDFKLAVQSALKTRTTIPHSYIDSTCPECFGALAILNSHKCKPNWEYYNNIVDGEFEKVVAVMIRHYISSHPNTLDLTNITL